MLKAANQILWQEGNFARLVAPRKKVCSLIRNPWYVGSEIGGVARRGNVECYFPRDQPEASGVWLHLAHEGECSHIVSLYSHSHKLTPPLGKPVTEGN